MSKVCFCLPRPNTYTHELRITSLVVGKECGHPGPSLLHIQAIAITSSSILLWLCLRALEIGGHIVPPSVLVTDVETFRLTKVAEGVEARRWLATLGPIHCSNARRDQRFSALTPPSFTWMWMITKRGAWLVQGESWDWAREPAAAHQSTMEMAFD